MANTWTSRRINNENSQEVLKSSKHQIPAGTQSAKKQAFSEIKNVIHNQQQLPGGATPFKGKLNAQKVDGLPNKFEASSSSLCKDVLRKQQSKHNFIDAQEKLEKLQLDKPESSKHLEKNKTKNSENTKQKELPKEPEIESNIFSDFEKDLIFDSSDFPGGCCNGLPNINHEEVWSEMEMADFQQTLRNLWENPCNEEPTKTDDSCLEADYFELDMESPQFVDMFPEPNDSGLHEISLPELPFDYDDF